MNNKSMGALKSPKDLRNYRISKITASIELPKEFVLAHSHIKNQGSVNSCVAHTLSEILETKDNINYSTGWIYGYRPEDYYQGYGMYTSEALKTINKIGYLTNDELNVNIEMKEAKDIVDKDLKYYTDKAGVRKINAYAWLNSINEIKQALYLYKTPVIVCFDVDSNGLSLDSNYIAQIPQNPSGGHATVCYGWNEIGLLIQNSWGEDWGNNGTFILPYEYPFYEAWMIQFEQPITPEIEDKDNNTDVTKPPIVKPNYYLIRKILMIIYNFIMKLFNKNK